MAAFPLHSRFPYQTHPPAHLLAAVATLRLGDIIRHQRKQLGFLLRSSLQEFSHYDELFGIKDVWNERGSRRDVFLESLSDVFSSTCSSCLYFFNGNENRKDKGDKGKPSFETSSGKSVNGRLWTNVLLVINVLVYVTQIGTHGRLMLWGAKINSLIDRGQLWRLATSSFLHANVGHLMVNCYSLNSIGPTVENVCGPRRFLAIYFISAVASSSMSYRFCQAPAVGASGAIFGLVGSFAVFVMRHRSLTGGGKQDMQHILRVIALNMVIGLLSRGIDNWGHLGGLLGGAAISWLLGPAWRYEFQVRDGRSVFADKAPILKLFGKKRT